MMKKMIFTLTFSLISLSTFGEYRVYQYNVKSNLKFDYDSKSYLVTSTLDPVSYQSYHGGKNYLAIDLIRTWTCKGNTAKKEICPSPEKLASR